MGDDAVGAYAALLLVHLHLPSAGSLKAKRSEVQSVKAQLHGRHGLTVAEVGHQDTWQLADVLVVLAASSGRQASETIDEIERLLFGGDDFEVSRVFVKAVNQVDELWDTGY